VGGYGGTWNEAQNYQILIETHAYGDHICPPYGLADVSLHMHSFQFKFDNFICASFYICLYPPTNYWVISYSGNNINLNEHSDRFESAYTVSWFPTSEGSKTQYKSSILPWESIDTTLSSTDIKKIGKNASNKKTVRMQRVLLYLASGLPSGCLRPGCPSWHMACWDCTALSSLLAIYKQIIINLLHPCSIILNSLLNVY